MCDKQDWERILELEKKVEDISIRIAKIEEYLFDKFEPQAQKAQRVLDSLLAKRDDVDNKEQVAKLYSRMLKEKGLMG